MNDEEMTALLEKRIEELCAISQTVKNILIKFVETLYKAVEKALPIINRLLANSQRKSWKMQAKQKIRPLYLDKRRKVHRCRNNC